MGPFCGHLGWEAGFFAVMRGSRTQGTLISATRGQFSDFLEAGPGFRTFLAIFEGPRPDFCGHFGQKFGIFDRTFNLKIPKIGAGLPAYYQGPGRRRRRRLSNAYSGKNVHVQIHHKVHA